MPTKLFLFLGVLSLLVAPPVWCQRDSEARSSSSYWLYADVPVWDIADEGLPFRATIALPSERDPLSRLLRVSENRWTVSLGYAKVYNSYDGATGIFKNPGGHAAMASAGRQFRWGFNDVMGAATPDLVIEFGLHAATRRFPADGTHANFKLITGLEWSFPTKNQQAWSAALIWPHFSNAGLLSRNAGYDGLALRLGRRFSF
ncbi:MAG TPA: acyloxyacyl hydrolase [Opitutaceae bacterium]|nr:acyloxyacyl hydrolase [Opitutaceae bacterium]